MFTKKCRCGKTEKNFMFDIGPFFINECCIEEGYDNNGNLTKKPAKVEISEVKPEEPVQPEKKKRGRKKSE